MRLIIKEGKMRLVNKNQHLYFHNFIFQKNKEFQMKMNLKMIMRKKFLKRKRVKHLKLKKRKVKFKRTSEKKSRKFLCEDQSECLKL
jgi:hypothetical protein